MFVALESMPCAPNTKIIIDIVYKKYQITINLTNKLQIDMIMNLIGFISTQNVFKLSFMNDIL